MVASTAADTPVGIDLHRRLQLAVVCQVLGAADSMDLFHFCFIMSMAVLAGYGALSQEAR